MKIGIRIINIESNSIWNIFTENPELSCSAVNQYANEIIVRYKQWNMAEEFEWVLFLYSRRKFERNWSIQNSVNGFRKCYIWWILFYLGPELFLIYQNVFF